MGRVHKKKIAQYSETAETDEQSVSGSKHDGDDEKYDENSDVDGDVPLNSAENSGSDPKKSDGNDGEQFSEAIEDDSEIDGDESDAEEEKPLVSKNGKKAASKRKLAPKNSKTEEHDDNDDAEEESGALAKNGVSPAKRGKKPKKVAKKKGKTAKVAPASNKDQENEDEEEEDGEEYEVKDIVGHKVEKGVNFYLIRWKGYTKDDDTWESEETLSCQDLIDKFKKKHNNGVTSESKRGRKKKSSSSSENKKRPGRPSTNQDPNKEWEVDKIIDFAEENKSRVFRIRWKGFGPKHDTWEPEANLSCGDLIEKFMKKMDSQKDVSFKHLRKTPKKTKRLVNETAVLPKELSARKSKRGAGKKRIMYADSDE